MSILNPGRADWRAPTGAALIGLGLGLGLGAAYLAGGMASHAVDYAHSQDIAVAAAAGYSGEVASPDLGQTMMRLVQPEGTRQRSAQFARVAKTRELDCLAEAVYFEARGESPRGQFAVAQVVMNRVKHPGFPKTVCGVVFQGARHAGCQFSFACDGSMGGRLEADAWGRARRIASRALAGAAIAEIGSATHFHTTGVSPAWRLEMARVTQVGEHIFYRLSPRKAALARAAAMQQAVLTSGPAPTGDFRLMSAVIEKTLETPPPLPETVATEPKAAPATPASKPAEAVSLKTSQPVTEAAS